MFPIGIVKQIFVKSTWQKHKKADQKLLQKAPDGVSWGFDCFGVKGRLPSGGGGIF